MTTDNDEDKRVRDALRELRMMLTPVDGGIAWTESQTLEKLRTYIADLKGDRARAMASMRRCCTIVGGVDGGMETALPSAVAHLVAERDQHRNERDRYREGVRRIREILATWSSLERAHEHGCGQDRACEACELKVILESLACDHSDAPGACMHCDEPVCMRCHRSREPHPGGVIKTIGGMWCDRPACVEAERTAHGVDLPWRSPAVQGAARALVTRKEPSMECLEIRELGIGAEVIIRKHPGGKYYARLGGSPCPDGGGDTPDAAVRGLLSGIDNVRSKIAATVRDPLSTLGEKFEVAQAAELHVLHSYIDDAKRAAGDERISGEPLATFIARMVEELESLRLRVQRLEAE